MTNLLAQRVIKPKYQKKVNVLVTGGAGFIGSNLVEALINESRVHSVRVLDNLSTGFLKNLSPFLHHPKLEFMHGDIKDYYNCLEACKGMDLISHQAALGSVPRSIKNPIATNATNITGTLNIFTAAKEQGVKRVVFAASSSTYGDSKGLPKKEDKIGNPLSPYAVTKYVSELYAKVFADLYEFEYIGLRYFNVFGPKQNPKGGYAAVIPLFMKAAIEGNAPTINGDGTYSRDFTFIENVIQANMLSLFAENPKAINQIYNVACGERTTLNELWEYISAVDHCSLKAKYAPIREGDIPHSLADISKINNLLGYQPKIKVKDGLVKTYLWYNRSLKGILKKNYSVAEE